MYGVKRKMPKEIRARQDNSYAFTHSFCFAFLFEQIWHLSRASVIIGAISNADEVYWPSFIYLYFSHSGLL